MSQCGVPVPTRQDCREPALLDLAGRSAARIHHRRIDGRKRAWSLPGLLVKDIFLQPFLAWVDVQFPWVGRRSSSGIPSPSRLEAVTRHWHWMTEPTSSWSSPISSRTTSNRSWT